MEARAEDDLVYFDDGSDELSDFGQPDGDPDQYDAGRGVESDAIDGWTPQHEIATGEFGAVKPFATDEDGVDDVGSGGICRVQSRASSCTSGLALDALEQALYARVVDPHDASVHHGDSGSAYLSIRYTERLAEAGIEPSVGSVGDSCDALFESIIGLYETEVVRPRGTVTTAQSSLSPPAAR